MKAKSKANAIDFGKSMIVLSSMVKRNVKNQYRNSWLGVIWTVLNPLLNMIVMAMVFSKLLGGRAAVGDYPVYILAGNTVFNFMRMATVNALHSIVINQDLLTKTRIKQYVFPVSNVFSALVNFFFSFIALIIVMVIRILMHAPVSFHWTMLMTIVPFLPSLILFVMGISLVLSVFYVYFRDIKHIYEVFLTLWMYATPLFYSLDVLKIDNPTINFIMHLNPMYHYVTYFRDITMFGNIPSLQEHLIIYAWGISMFLIGALIFHFNKKKLLLRI